MATVAAIVAVVVRIAAARVAAVGVAVVAVAARVVVEHTGVLDRAGWVCTAACR